MMPTPALPNACGAGLKTANASVLNQRWIVRCDVGSSGSPTRFGRARRSPPRFSTVEPPSVAVNAKPALQHMDATELPAPEQQVERRAPVAAEPSTAAERKLPHVARHESMSDVELCRAAIGCQIVAVLRLAEGSGVEARAAAAGRDVIGRVGDRLAKRVAHQRRQPVRVAFLERDLKRVVIGADPVLHPLDVAERRVWTLRRPSASRWRSE